MFRKLKRMDTRRVGLQRPWNDNQLLNWIINFLFTGLALFYIVFFTAFEIPQLVVVSIVYCALLAVFWISFVYCQVVDPSSTRIRLPQLGYGRNSKRIESYCSVCRKKVPGLDHHCSWLGTCIGKNNYLAFIMLLLSGLVQFGFSVASLTPEIRAALVEEVESKVSIGNVEPLVFTVAILNAVVGLGLAFRYFSLVRFHVLLMYHGIGTYDYLSSKREKELERRLDNKDKYTIQETIPNSNIAEQIEEEAQEEASTTEEDGQDDQPRTDLSEEEEKEKKEPIKSEAVVRD